MQALNRMICITSFLCIIIGAVVVFFIAGERFYSFVLTSRSWVVLGGSRGDIKKYII